MSKTKKQSVTPSPGKTKARQPNKKEIALVKPPTSSGEDHFKIANPDVAYQAWYHPRIIETWQRD